VPIPTCTPPRRCGSRRSRSATSSLGNFSSLNKIQEASLPLEKEGPNRGKLILGAFLVGLFLGLGLLVLRALPDDVVRTRDDLERIDGLAVIGVMPRIDGKNLRRHTALREQGW
jgi:capsular polysaccharide biosynthesis protein